MEVKIIFNNQEAIPQLNWKRVVKQKPGLSHCFRWNSVYTMVFSLFVFIDQLERKKTDTHALW
jgi:hypothetical protein